jgi:predicted MFS family arabinose efflux permease
MQQGPLEPARVADAATRPRTAASLPAERRRWQAFSALRHREFRLLWLGLIVSNVGSWMQMVALGWLVYSLTNSPFWLGLVGFVRAVPVFVFTLWGGVLADRADRRVVLLVANSTVALLALVLGMLVVTGTASVGLVLLIAFLTAAAWSFEVPSRQSLVPDLVPPDDTIRAIALQSAAFNGAGVVGPAIAALIIDRLGIAGAFLVNGVLSFAVVVALLLMQPVRRRVAGAGSALSNLVEGFRYVQSAPVIAALFAMIAVTSLIARPYLQLMPVFARDVLQVGASGLGMLMGLIGAGGLVGAFAIASLGSYRRRGQVLVASGMIFCLLLVAFAASPWFVLSSLLCFGLGFTQNFFFASTNTMIQTNVPGALRGRLISMYAFIMMGFMPLGSMFVGSLGELIGVPPTVALGGAVSLLVLVGTMLKVPRLRSLE